MLSKWNLGLWHKAIKQKCEVNCVCLHQVEPRYTSQTCPRCGNVDKGNRDGTLFRCIACGYESNADLNASINILNRFCQERVNLSSDIVPDMAKTDFIVFHWNWQLSDVPTQLLRWFVEKNGNKKLQQCYHVFNPDSFDYEVIWKDIEMVYEEK